MIITYFLDECFYQKNSPTDDIPTLNAGADKDSNPKSEKSGNRIESLFGRLIMITNKSICSALLSAMMVTLS